jgi:hypothetical protein
VLVEPPQKLIATLEDRMNNEAVIETLECAKINVDNILRVGPVMLEAVKMQIDDAIKMLEAEDENGS